MARTESAMIELGSKAPTFVLEDVITTRKMSIDEVRGERGLLMMFICRHCPFVKHVEKELAAIGKEYAGKGISIVAISSNDADCYSDDSPPSLRRQAEELGFAFPYLFDETQQVARAYDATCTPDFFLFDKEAGARLSRATRRQPPGQWRPGRRPRFTRGHERIDRRHANLWRAEAEHWVQHQVESIVMPHITAKEISDIRGTRGRGLCV